MGAVLSLLRRNPRAAGPQLPGHPKKIYSDVINILAPFNIFAGGFTIATQFLVPCSQGTLQKLLTISTQLFLASIFGLVIVFLLLYGFEETVTIEDRRHFWVVLHLSTAGITMMVAFFFVGAAIIVSGNRIIGGIGFGLLLILAVTSSVNVWHIMNHDYKLVGHVNSQLPVQRAPDLQEAYISLFWVLYVLEVSLFFVLVGVGIWHAVDQGVEQTCNNTSLVS